jgi:tellurite resistance protein
MFILHSKKCSKFYYISQKVEFVLRNLCKRLEVKSNVEEWKARREVKKLEHRANRAEDYATTSIAVAMEAMEEAEGATLEALSTRLDAEAATGNKKK